MKWKGRTQCHCFASDTHMAQKGGRRRDSTVWYMLWICFIASLPMTRDKASALNNL
jgi:hypothetical protein